MYILEKIKKRKTKLQEGVVKADFIIEKYNRYHFSFSYELELTTHRKDICFSFIPDYYIEDFLIKVSGTYIKPDDGKILGMTKVEFSFAVSIPALVIIIIVVVVIICIKRRKKNKEKSNTDKEIPLFSDSEN